MEYKGGGRELFLIFFYFRPNRFQISIIFIIVILFNAVPILRDTDKSFSDYGTKFR